jgi:spore maturation protein CgeB
MKLLYIPSGHKRIYEFFDMCIIRTLKRLNIDFKVFHPFEEISTLSSIIQDFNPTIMLTMNGDKLSKGVLRLLSNHCVKKILWLTEDPYYIDRTMDLIGHYDYVFTIESSAVEIYQQTGHNHIYHLPLGTDPNTFYPSKKGSNYHFDLCLVGFPYASRIKLITLLLEETPYSVLVVGRWKGVINHKRLSVRHGWIHPKRVSSFYQHAKINLNTLRHYKESGNENSLNVVNESINNRTFDIAASNSFQIVQYCKDLSHLFQEKEEITSFQSHQELLQKIDYYLHHPEERAQIAKNSTIKTLAHHTFAHRLEYIFKIVEHEEYEDQKF